MDIHLDSALAFARPGAAPPHLHADRQIIWVLSRERASGHDVSLVEKIWGAEACRASVCSRRMPEIDHLHDGQYGKLRPRSNGSIGNGGVLERRPCGGAVRDGVDALDPTALLLGGMLLSLGFEAPLLGILECP